MKNITKILLISIVLYSIVIGLSLYLGGGWYTGTVIGVLGLVYDIHSYIRLRKGKSIFTYRTLKSLFKKKPEKVTLYNGGFNIGDKRNVRRQNVDKTLGEKRF